MKTKREWIWGFRLRTDIRIRGRVDNANGLEDGYVRVWKEGTNKTETICVPEDEDPRIGS